MLRSRFRTPLAAPILPVDMGWFIAPLVRESSRIRAPSPAPVSRKVICMQLPKWFLDEEKKRREMINASTEELMFLLLSSEEEHSLDKAGVEISKFSGATKV